MQSSTERGTEDYIGVANVHLLHTSQHVTLSLLDIFIYLLMFTSRKIFKGNSLVTSV